MQEKREAPIGTAFLVGIIIGSGVTLNVGLLFGWTILGSEQRTTICDVQNQPEVIILERGSERLIRVLNK